MKKFLIVAGLLTVIATPAMAQSFDPVDGGNVLSVAYASRVHHSGRGAFAQKVPVAERNTRALNNARGNVGIFENLPAGVTDPYAYHNALMAIP